MTRSGVRIVAGVLFILGAAARPLASQQPRPLADSPRMLALARERPLRTCPMPVAIPDRSRVERMPVAPTDARGHYIQVVPPGCVNPLFGRQAPDTMFVPAALLRRSDSLTRSLLGAPRRDSLRTLRIPLPVADSIPGLRLPLAPLPPPIPPR